MEYCAILPMPPATMPPNGVGVIMEHVRVCYDERGETSREVLGPAIIRRADGTAETPGVPVSAQVYDQLVDAPRRAVATAETRASAAIGATMAAAEEAAARAAAGIEGAVNTANNIATGVTIAVIVGVVLVVLGIGWLIYKLPAMAPHIARTAASGASIAKSVR